MNSRLIIKRQRSAFSQRSIKTASFNFKRGHRRRLGKTARSDWLVITLDYVRSRKRPASLNKEIERLGIILGVWSLKCTLTILPPSFYYYYFFSSFKNKHFLIAWHIIHTQIPRGQNRSLRSMLRVCVCIWYFICVHAYYSHKRHTIYPQRLECRLLYRRKTTSS